MRRLQHTKVVTSTLLIILLGVTVTSIVNAQSYDYVYQEIEAEARVESPRQAHYRYSLTIRNIRITSIRTWTVSLRSHLDSLFLVDKVYDSSGTLNYDHLKTDGESLQIKVIFGKPIDAGETYRFTYEFTAKWGYNGYDLLVGWSTSRLIEKIRLKISVLPSMRIVRTYPAGVFSDDRRSAETEATNVKNHVLLASYPPTTGKQSVLALLVEFSDIKHRISREEISRTIFQEMSAYFKEISFNQISIAGDTTDWIGLPRSAGSYNISGWGSSDINRRAFEEEAVRAADDVVDYSRYNLVFIVTTGRYHETVWAYSAQRMIRTRDNMTIERITVQTEDTPWGTFAHEFGHALGLPDLYDYRTAARPGVYLEAAIYVGPYGLMSRSVDRPHMLGWSKLTLGWIPSRNVQIVGPGEDISVRINRLESLSDGIMLVKIPLSPKQYYLVEVRDRTGYDSALPETGVLVTFVDEMIEGGNGPVRLVDANPSTRTLDDAPFNLEAGKISVFTDIEKRIGMVILQKGEGWYLVHFTKPDRIEEVRQLANEAARRIEQAEREIEKARSEVFWGLDAAVRQLEQAKTAWTGADYRQAINLASNVPGTIEKARTIQLLIVTAMVVGAVLTGGLTFRKLRSEKRKKSRSRIREKHPELPISSAIALETTEFPISQIARFAWEHLRMKAARTSLALLSVVLSIAFMVFLGATTSIFGIVTGQEAVVQTHYFLLLVISLLVCGAGITNSMLMSVTERYQEIGTMKCLGTRDKHVVLIFLFEALVFGLVGGFAGGIAGTSLAILLSILQFGTGIVAQVPLIEYLNHILFGVVSALVLSEAGSLYPAYYVANLTPVEALRHEL